MEMSRNVIVIGAAEGSLSALRRLLSALPASLPAAVLVVLHAPLETLQLDLMLDKTGFLPTVYAKETQTLQEGYIHLAAPDSEMVARPGGSLGIEPIPLGLERHRMIDRLLQSAADVWGFRVVAVILSGCGGAGTQGLRAVEHANGIAIVQDPEEAVVPEMPRHAIEHDNPHHVVPISGIIELLMALTQKEQVV